MAEKLKLDRSMELYKEASKIIPAGVGSNARLMKSACHEFGPCSIFIEKAVGSYIWDVDGNEYIDYRLGYGPVIIGHSYKEIHDAVHLADEKGLVYASDNELMIEVAKTICRFVPSIKMLRFASSGTEATMGAIRVAKAFTKKDKIIKFEGHYHGWHDAVSFSTKPGYHCAREAIPASLGISNGMSNYTLVCEWNNFESIERKVKDNYKDVAAIITEPVMGNASAIPPNEGYLKYLRELCDEYGILLIFDEVKTGFRLGKGGAQGLFNVTPDLSTFAKSMGNGYPIAAFGGRKDIMELIGPGKVMHGGTYSANPVSLTACKATLKELDKSSVWDSLYSYGKKMMKGIDEILEDHKIPHVVHGFPTMFQFLITDKERITAYRDLAFCDMKMFTKVQYELLKRGVMVDEDGEEAIYTSCSHSSEDLDKTLEALDDALGDLK
ncbi:aspartate aminotransferase family protein [Candidatus Methanoperedens nitratireducens]|uniref:Glutamate-1-semialdehyde 2,1-aminomutase n=1 Tax=Candidatus Methanoperedens nitratireducens TaxID=1392998 RepID=A0A284VM72_9EURY|nr:glutamate-1-semialdehyde 2,1-aminomutase [Candidatus Methanoperedens nitroreducens]SNQ60342.1 Glutamate-1-semialdehyde 2,1-aminomutase [Candidatus Methanoperedens nitroreducens]